jgi:GH24 family phage-related lysozyme (muramidase)
MSAVSDICSARIIRLNEEGYRPNLYDDSDDSPVVTKGQPTIGYGTRCMQWSEEFSAKVMSLELGEVYETDLLQKSWYVGCDDMRRSALLEIAYNQGISGLVNGYPNLIAAVAAEDWPRAQAECTVQNVNVKSRYVRIGQILLTGVDE